MLHRTRINKGKIQFKREKIHKDKSVGQESKTNSTDFN